MFKLWNHARQEYERKADDHDDIFDIMENYYKAIESPDRSAARNEGRPALKTLEEETNVTRGGYRLEKGLTTRHKEILISRLVDNWTFCRIGREYGIHTSRAAKVFYQARDRLHADLEKYQEWADFVGIVVDLEEVEGW